MSLPPLHYFLVRAKKEQCVVGKTTPSSSPLPKSCLEFNSQFIPVHTDTNKQHFTPGVATLCHFITSCKCHDHLGLLQLKTNIKTRQGEQWKLRLPKWSSFKSCLSLPLSYPGSKSPTEVRGSSEWDHMKQLHLSAQVERAGLQPFPRLRDSYFSFLPCGKKQFNSSVSSHLTQWICYIGFWNCMNHIFIRIN